MLKNYHYWKISSFKLMYLHNYRLDLFHQRSQSKSLYTCRNLGCSTINPDHALKSWSWNRHKSSYSEDLDSSRFSNEFFSKNTDLSSFFKVSPSYFYFNNLIEEVTSHPLNGILRDQKLQKVLLVLTCLDIQSHVSSALPPSISVQLVKI